MDAWGRAGLEHLRKGKTLDFSMFLEPGRFVSFEVEYLKGFTSFILKLHGYRIHG